MIPKRIRTTDALGDALAEKHLLAEEIARTNAGAKKASSVKFPKKCPENVKKLVKFYIFEKYKRVAPKAYKHIREAYELYTEYYDRSSVRWLLEALILGGCSDTKAADLCGLDKPAVSYYKEFYFNLAGKNKDKLRAKSVAMASNYVDADRERWGYKAEVMVNGLDWFIRTRILRKPTAEDRKITDRLIRDRIELAKLDASLMLGNPTNYKYQEFLDMVDRVGTTYNHVQKDVQQENRPGLEHSEELNNMVNSRILEALVATGKDPEKGMKVSAFSEEKQAEEKLLQRG